MTTTNQKIVIITGANSGIGKAAAFRFARGGYTVIMACRSLERSRPVLETIKQTTDNPHVHLMELDTSSMASIQKFSDDFKQRYAKLDVLINNAAYFEHGAEYRLSPDGIELTFATNVVGPYLLIRLLKDRLEKSDDARVLNASSNIIKHFFSPKRAIDFENLRGHVNPRKKHSVYNAYCSSKMALLMTTFTMAEELKNSGIKVNALQINGARMSKETLQKFKWNWRIIAGIQNLFFPPAEKMADNYYEICTSDRFKDVTGKLINDKLEIMQVAPENAGIKVSFGSSFYPAFAERRDVQEEVVAFCEERVGS